MSFVWVRHALAEIEANYGVRATIDKKDKALLKFGRNQFVGTSRTTVMGLAGEETEETYVSANVITHIASSDAGDTGEVVLEGHIIAGQDLSFVVQKVTLDGQTPVSLPKPLARATRVFNDSAVNWAGDCYVFNSDGLAPGVVAATTLGVPDAAKRVHLIGDRANNQSLKCSTSLSSVDFAIVTSIFASINKKQAGQADVDFCVRLSGKVFRTVLAFDIASGGASSFIYYPTPYIICPANSDVLIQATGSAMNLDISAGFNSTLAIVV